MDDPMVCPTLSLKQHRHACNPGLGDTCPLGCGVYHDHVSAGPGSEPAGLEFAGQKVAGVRSQQPEDFIDFVGRSAYWR